MCIFPFKRPEMRFRIRTQPQNVKKSRMRWICFATRSSRALYCVPHAPSSGHISSPENKLYCSQPHGARIQWAGLEGGRLELTHHPALSLTPAHISSTQFLLRKSSKLSQSRDFSPEAFLAVLQRGGITSRIFPQSRKGGEKDRERNMATTTCTRFTDEYQLYEELGK